MPVKAVILDWAGTMIDFGSRAPVIAMQQVFAEAGVPIGADTVRRYMGMAKREHVIAMLTEREVAANWRKARGEAWSEADVDALMKALEPAMKAAADANADLIPGALDAVEALRAEGVRIGSTTGYTPTMMAGIRAAATRQGYTPDSVVCAGDTVQGRPAPLMIWKTLVDLGVWPASEVVVIDDASVGIEAGRHAGCWTVAVAASGNALGVTHADYLKLSPDDVAASLEDAIEEYRKAGADFVIRTVADLGDAIAEINARLAEGGRPGDALATAYA